MVEPLAVPLSPPPTAQMLDDPKATTHHVKRSSNLRFVPTLLRKNWMLKKKHPVGFLFEIMTPVLFIILMSVIKHQTKEYTIPAGFATNKNGDSLLNPYGSSVIAEWFTPKYVVPETTMSGLLLHMATSSFHMAREKQSLSVDAQRACGMQVMYGGRVSLNASSPYAVPNECNGLVSPFKLAITPDNAFTRAYFYETMKQWYPRVQIDLDPTTKTSIVVPSFEDSVVFYNTEKELEDYVVSKEYATQVDKPRIFGALVFQEFPSVEAIGSFAPIEYAIRMNATYVGMDQEERYVPRTISNEPSKWNPFQRSLETKTYTQYATGGFMTLQTLVARFVNCMPAWDATTKKTTGVCQAKDSTAVSNSELDDRLLETVLKDPATMQVISSMVQALGGASNVSISMATPGEAFTLPIGAKEQEALLRPLRQAPQPYLGATTSPFPIEQYNQSTFYDVVKDVFPVFFLLTYMSTLSKILVSLVTERETRSRELMKILGVKESSIVLSWYVTYATILFVSSIFQAIAAKAGLFENSDIVVLFLFFFLFSLSILAYSFMVSSIFSKARTGTYIGVVGFFVMYVVSNGFNEASTESSKNTACLFSPVAMVFTIDVLSTAETTQVGMTFSNAASLVGNFRFSTSLWSFFLDTILYTLLGLYLEKVVPKAYGTTEKWYFPLNPWYWRRRRRALNVKGEEMDATTVVVNPNVESVSEDLVDQERTGAALCVQGLRKVFSVPGGEKVAVKSLHLNMYSGQITCLLGHNGAGKTTLISMLTGVIPPTAGDAYFRGLSVREDMDELRESLGICFQHDVLYPELTVEDHLRFYAQIKGYKGEHLENEITHKITEVGLVDKRHVVSSALSGGMKRKLSVAIALLGDSSLVFLDEPTSGMDPYSRRSTWEILMNNREGRVLVLTTHFMDEADVLGDRIAIMAEGELRCAGSPLFLKNRYGAGYNLTIVKEEGCNDALVIDFVLGRIPSGRVLSNVGMEVAFQLPLDASAQFPTLFRELDAQLTALGLRSYGISVTTMEEVFIKVAEAADDDDPAGQHTLANKVKHHAEARVSTPNSSSTPTSTVSPRAPRQQGSMFGTQFVAMVQKRCRIAKRDRKFAFISLLLPIAWLVLGLSLLKGADIVRNDPNVSLTTGGLAAAVPGKRLVLPSFCMKSTGDWCETAFSPSYFTDAQPTLLDQSVIGNPPFSTDTPTVFGIDYSATPVNRTDTTGYLLKLEQVIYDRGYKQATTGQLGAYLAHADDKQRLLSYNLLVNTTVPNAAVLFKRSMDEAIYRLLAKRTSSSVDVSKLSLKVNHYPLPQSALTTALFTSYITFDVCILVAIAFAYYPASIVVLLVKERQPEHNSKHQQLVSGANLVAFWLANYVWDLLVYIIPGGMALVLFQLYGLDTLTGSSKCVTCTSETFPAVITLFVLFGFAVCPFAYCLSFLFKQHASAQTKVILINFGLGLLLMIVSLALDIIESTQSLNKVLKWIYRFSPIYCLSNGLLDLTLQEINANVAYDGFVRTKKGPFALENVGYEILFLAISAVLYFVLAVGIDYSKTFPKVKTMLHHETQQIVAADPTQDEDVLAEAERVASGRADGDVIKLQSLRKVYPAGGKVAVKNLSFGLKRGECFGFLGINGAGKTTTMKMLTGDIAPTSGTATLAGFDILSQQLDVRREIGYCPQFDALIDLLSVREHLELFARIKGVPTSELENVIQEKMEQLNLKDFENKLAGSLSGGNKRKLSVAIAMIGSPSILFLDEPSTGMDPVSRRFMWDVISEISTYNKESTVVLTTHSMEECEALCTRVGIMVGGGLTCLGSVQHLKSRFGDGLMFDAKLLPVSSDEARSLALRHFDSIEMQVTQDRLGEVCGLFGQPSWESKIVDTHPTGYAIANALRRDGYVLATTLAMWWLVEERFEHLGQFLKTHFGSNVDVLERQNDSCWFKLRDDEHFSHALKLSTVFDVIESAKSSLAIREYSVSQTTLEQIFNSFASQQDKNVPIPSTPTA